MLIGKIRKGIKSPFVKVFLMFLMITLIGGFGLLGIVKKIIYGNKDGIAWVNGYAIDRNDYRDRVRKEKEAIDNLFRRFGKQAEMLMAMNGMENNPEKTALNALIQEELIDQTIRAFPLYISPEYLKARLQDPYYLNSIGVLMPPHVLNSQGRIDPAAFQKYLAEGNLKPMEKEITEEIRRSTAFSLIEGAVYVPQFVAKEEHILKDLGKKYSIATYSLNTFLKAEEAQSATDGEISSFFEKNKSHYYTPARRSGTKWEFTASDFDIKVTDKEITEYYNKVKHGRFIEAPAHVKIREIVFNQVKEKGLITLKEEAEKVYQEALKNPSEFADLAKKHSTGTTAKNGGLVDFFKRGTKEKILEQAAFRLKNNNDIAPLIETKDGFIIVQRVDRKEALFKPLDKVKKEIVQLLTDKKFASQFSRAAYTVTHIKGDDAQEKLDEFISKNKGKKSVIDPVTKSEEAIAGRLFSLKKSGDRLAYVSEGKGYIIELKDIIKTVLPPFEMLKPYVLKDLHRENAYKALKHFLDTEKKKALNNQKIETSEYGTIQKTGFLKPSEQEEFKKLFEQGIPQEITTLSKEKGIFAHLSDDKGFLIMLDEVESLDQKLFEEKHDKLKLSLFNNYKQLLIGSFIASLNRTAKIEVNTVQQRAESSYDF